MNAHYIINYADFTFNLLFAETSSCKLWLSLLYQSYRFLCPVLINPWRTGEDEQVGWMGANQNFSRELGLYLKNNPTRLSSNSAKTAQL
jgi:hypothetical protein